MSFSIQVLLHSGPVSRKFCLVRGNSRGYPLRRSRITMKTDKTIRGSYELYNIVKERIG